MDRFSHAKCVLFGLAAVALLAAEPAAAQVSLVGYWNPVFDEDWLERIPGPDIGDYAGLPINSAAQRRADTWDASLLTLLEHQCKPHPSTYGFRGVGQMRIWEDRDPLTQRLIKINTHIQWQEQRREIWMDGRPHPSEFEPHTWQGFSTGRFEGDVLVVRTTHLKAGWVRRNGIPLSDRATMTERFFRYDGVLTHVMMIEDPVYLTEPLIKTNGFALVPNGTMEPYPCRPAVEVPRELGDVPHHLPGDIAHTREFADQNKLPFEATRGGAETALPEYMLGPPDSRPRPAREPAAGDPAAAGRAAPDATAAAVRSFKVQGNVYMVAGPGGNVAVQVGDDGVLAVDTQSVEGAGALLSEIRRISGGKPIRWVINTHVHADHTGGNQRFRAAGDAIVAGNVAMDISGNRGAAIIAHQNVQTRMSQAGPDQAPSAALPTDTFFQDRDEVSFNGEAVEIIHQPAAHTDGDVLVFFRKSDVIAAGDIFTTTTYPFIDIARGGTIDGIIAGLNRIIAMTVPRDKQEGGTMVIPGHGRISDEAGVVEYRDMLTIVRDRIRDMIGKGMTLDQIRAAAPSSDYDGRYGSATGPWTTAMFVEAIYRTLEGASR